jgi:hypothetical protein
MEKLLGEKEWSGQIAARPRWGEGMWASYSREVASGKRIHPGAKMCKPEEGDDPLPIDPDVS